MLFRLLLFLPVVLWAQAPPPVVLVNGYQQPPCADLRSQDTFGQLEEKLRAAGREVIWFNNCSVAPSSTIRPTMEELGAALGVRIEATGAAQVDLVVHSMGGLILRSYLSGKQNTPGLFTPPATPRVRKAVFLGTPHFGPGFAQLLGQVGGQDPQVRAVLPASQFLFDLTTWNQGTDDLRGIDAIAVAGNSAPFNSFASGGDGLVAVTSASLGFALGEGRLRLIPYCHTNSGALALVSQACRQPPYLASVDSDEHLSWRIVRSFLDGTAEWQTLGTAPQGTVASSGGLMLMVQDRDGNPATGVTRVTAGPVEMTAGSAGWYSEFLPASLQPLRVTAAAGEQTSAATVRAATYQVALVKPGPRVGAVLPAAAQVPSLVRAPGMFLSIYGVDLATQPLQAPPPPYPTTLGGTQVLMNGSPIAIHYVSPGQLNVVLPDSAQGLVTLELRTAGGSQKTRVLVETAAPAVFLQGNAAAALNAVSYAPVGPSSPARAGDFVSLFVTGLGATELRGALEWARQQPVVLLGGQSIMPAYAGRAPGFPGLDQVNFQIPAGFPAGLETPIEIRSGARTSNRTTLAIQ